MNKTWIKGYYKDPATGKVTEYEGYAVDVRDAVRRYPNEYSTTPPEEAKAAKPEPAQRKIV